MVAKKTHRSSLSDEGLTLRRKENTGRLLAICARGVQEQVIGRLRENGHPDLRVAHNAVLMHVSLTGTRQSDLALRAGVTRQAIAQLVDRLVELKYLRRQRDPTDGRAQLISYTARGREVLEQGLAVVENVESELRKLLGDQGFRQLNRSLQKIAHRHSDASV